MNGFVRLLVAGIFIVTSTSVVKAQDDALDAELQDDFADFGDSNAPPAENPSQPTTNQTPPPEQSSPDEFTEFGTEEQPKQEPPPPEIVEEKAAPTPTPGEPDLDAELSAEPPPPEQNADVQPAPAPEPVPAPEPQVAPEPPQAVASSGDFKYNIRNLKYRPNDAGGTVVIEGDGPLSYSLRKNQETNQFVVEIPNARLPDKLKRPLNTKDIGGPYGSIDAYQNSGSTTARVVVQLRKGAQDPIIQTEGNSVLVIASMSEVKGTGEEISLGADTPDSTQPTEQGRIAAPAISTKPLDAKSLEEFLASNRKFYGERQSFETVDMDLREFFYKYMAEWSGLNIFVDDAVKGSLSIKLTDIPWDQAFVDILKWKKLGYVRLGDNSLRIALQSDITKELEDMARMVESKRALQPLITKKYYLSFVGADDQAQRVSKYLSKRGIMNANSKVQILVITDTEEVLKKVEEQIRHDDIAPRQVLIEAKIVEVSEQFKRNFGITWGISGKQVNLGSSNGRNIRSLTSFNISPGANRGTFGLDFQLGQLDVIGDLSAQLSLFEQEGTARVISSPRIVTMNQQTAAISQETKIPYQTGTRQTGASGQTESVPTVNFVPVPLNLSVTPQITYEGSVIMKVKLERTFALGSAAGAPQTEKREADTQVMVRNGQTAVMGGIYQSDTSEGSNKVPFVADIPIIGWLFKNKDVTRTKNELLLFLTPKILGDLGQDYEAKAVENKAGESL